MVFQESKENDLSYNEMFNFFMSFGYIINLKWNISKLN